MALVLSFWTGPALRADVTIRYQSEIKPAAALQPMLEAFLKTAQIGSSTSVRMKGNLGYTTAGNWIEIFDFTKQEVTLVDPAHKTVVTLPVSQLADKMANALPHGTSAQMQAAEQAMASVKINVESKMTGKTAEILGVQAEERELTMTMDIPIPAGGNQTGQAGPSVTMVMHLWTAKKEEALRNPAIRELTGYQAWQKYVMNPAGILEKLVGKLPGMSNTMEPMLQEIFKNPSVILRTQVEMYMPFLAAMAKQMSEHGQAGPAIDPDAPLLTMNQEVVELSNAPVDASIFEIPKDYKTVPAEEVIRDMLPAPNKQ
jgi:hypothetical protein